VYTQDIIGRMRAREDSRCHEMEEHYQHRMKTLQEKTQEAQRKNKRHFEEKLKNHACVEAELETTRSYDDELSSPILRLLDEAADNNLMWIEFKSLFLLILFESFIFSLLYP